MNLPEIPVAEVIRWVNLPSTCLVKVKQEARQVGFFAGLSSNFAREGAAAEAESQRQITTALTCSVPLLVTVGVQYWDI